MGKKRDSASVFLGEELRERLQQAAEEERRTLSQLIRIAVEDWLNAHYPS